MTSTGSSLKQRKLSDLRVIDLQRELRSFNIVYDKKELKGALLEKLRQALIDRNIDPENYLFDISSDLKSISSDENNRNPEENGSHELNALESSTMETDSEQQFNADDLVQTSDPDNEDLDEIHRLDSLNSGDNLAPKSADDEDEDEDDNIFLTIDQTATTKQEDENNNESSAKSLPDRDQPSDVDLDVNSQSNEIPQSSNGNSNEQPTESSPTTNLSTDDDNRSKSETNPHEPSEDQPKKSTVNKDQCHLWVSNIAKETHASHLKDLFSKYGKVLTTKVIGSSSSRWFGYINLATPEDVEKCIHALHQTELHGKKIYVDREMHEEPSRPPTTDTPRKYSDHAVSSSKTRDVPSDKDKDLSSSASKRSTSSSSSNESRKKLSTTEVHRSHENDSSNKRPPEARRDSSSQPSRSFSSRQDLRKPSRDEKPAERSARYSSDLSKPNTSSPTVQRSRSREKHSLPSSNKFERPRSSSIDRSKQQASSKSEKPKDTHRSHYEAEQRVRHEKEVLERKQYVQHQEEEIKEQQRRLAEERERMRREFEILERERHQIERTRLVLEKEKQDQARELEKQQRHIADEAKRRHQIEDQLRDEKLQRLAHNDNKRPRSSLHSTSTTSSNNGSHANKGYEQRSSSNAGSERERNRDRDRDRSANERNREYYPEPKRQYIENSSSQREPLFRDRPTYRDSELPGASSSFGLPSSSANANSSRYPPSSSNPPRLADPYGTLPPRGRDTALPLTSAVSTAYERSSRNPSSSATNPNAMARRPPSRERFENRDYLQQTQRRERSPLSSSSTMRREPPEASHWERSKSRDVPHYNDDTHKYLPAPYLSESSASSQQQGLWSAAPPSRQTHHHSDLPVKTGSHPPVTDPYSWQRVPQQGPPQSHHPQGLASSHDRSRGNVPSNQRIPILPSNQPPPPPPPLPSSSRGSAAGQAHLYNHPGVPLNTLPTSQQHASLTAPPSSLRHPTTYITQAAPPAGLVLHPTSQARPYEQHYVVAPSLSQRRY